MSPVIPLADLRREYDRLHSDIDRAIARVLRSGWFIGGEEVKAFEAEWAAYCSTAHAAAVSNGTDAVYLALRAAGIGPGDEVVVPALAPAAAALGVQMAGATLLFADVDADRYTLDPAALEAAITPRTVAVVPVHLYGCPADMAAIGRVAQAHGLFVVEDAAHAPGAHCEGQRVGRLGHASTFSFYPGRNLGAYGEAGAIATNDGALAEKVRRLRRGGRGPDYDYQVAGIDSRMDELQAAILRVKLPRLDKWNQQRRALAARYRAGLDAVEDLVLPAEPDNAEHVFNFYIVRTALRESLHEYLAGAGVTSGFHYPRALHQQPAFAARGEEPAASCPNAEQIAAEVLSLPMFPYLTAAEVQQIARLVRIFFAMR
ncbi:MAG: DegT/DnrJ/EryC1/StrS family aminotransferase [Anaerolineae bacterium]|jgi:dTDP-4-amino-4,6-dideoxygalactose transaminase